MCLWITFSQAIALDRFEPYRVNQFCRFGHFILQKATFGIYSRLLKEKYLLKDINFLKILTELQTVLGEKPVSFKDTCNNSKKQAMTMQCSSKSGWMSTA